MTEETVVRMVDVDKIRIPPFQVRESAADLEDLRLSVERMGVIEPIILRQLESDDFELVAGYRRLSAVRASGQTRIPALIRKLTDQEAFRMQVGENVGREDLTDQEKTKLVSYYAVQYKKSPKEISQDLGVSYSWVVKYLPAELKNEKMAELGRKSAEAAVTRRATEETRDVEDAATHDQLVEALDTAEYPACPVCTRQPTKISSQGLPYVVCQAGHTWNIHRGATSATGSYLDRMKECAGGCGLIFDKSSLDENGLCDKCRLKKEQNKKGAEETADEEIREAIGMPGNIAVIAEPPRAPITFLVELPHSIPEGKVTAVKLTELYKKHSYDQTLPHRSIGRKPEGLVVSFELGEWLNKLVADEIPSGSTNAEVFKMYLSNILESEELASAMQTSRIQVTQLEPKLAEEPEKQRKVKEIDFERVGRCCPCCGRPIVPEAYEYIKKRFGQKYPDLFKE